MTPVSHHLVTHHNRRNSIGVKAAVQGSRHRPHHLFGATIALLFFSISTFLLALEHHSASTDGMENERCFPSDITGAE